MKYIIFIFCTLLLSCNQTRLTSSHSKKMKTLYIDDFKLTYLQKCLIRGFNNTEEIRNIIYNDHSGFSENLFTLEDYNIIDSFVKIDNEIMVKDSANSIGRVAEGAEGKRVLSYALYRYQSKWLDSLAKARWKLSKNNF